MKKIVKIILAGCILSFLVGVIGVFGIVNHYKKELPNIAELIESYSPSVPTRVYDINGKQIDELYKEIRIPARIEEVPMISRNAFLAIEDRRFYSHYGIDPIGILRAIVTNIRYKSAKQGASTFTQQLARNAFLSHDKKLSRKIKEAILTIEIEKTYTKDEIFEKYLNEIYFGEGDYGIKSAAKSLFHKDISNINIPEAAVLAGIPNRPRYYNPRRNLKASLNRMRIVLSQMKKFNMITEEEYETAMRHKFIKIDDVKDIKKVDLKNTTIIYNRAVINKSLAPSFTDLVHDYLIENFDEEAIYNDGLQVYTTLNFDMQKIAEETFDNYKPLMEDKKLQGGMISINSSNGYITSIVGGKNFKPRNFNRAIMANRQIGSSFKPFVYFTAILDGKSENTIIEDSRLVQGNWAPRNYGTLFRKNITLVEGLNRSINMVAIKLLKGVGFNKLFDVVGKLDSNLNPPRDLTAALGSVSSSPLNLAKAYSVFSNGGYVVEPLVVIEVKDKNGNTLIKNTPKIKEVFDPKDIALTTNLLENSVQGGTSTRA
ncbi:MAG: transglycosylase domain-containing protein, partial [Fusobacterium sp.]